jgi:hypothetical protein
MKMSQKVKHVLKKGSFKHWEIYTVKFVFKLVDLFNVYNSDIVYIELEIT